MNLYKGLRTSRKYLFLPIDLFNLLIGQITDDEFNIFIKFIENIYNRKGWYFKSHYMHSKIKFYDLIYPDDSFIIKLSPYTDILKSIEARLSNGVST